MKKVAICVLSALTLILVCVCFSACRPTYSLSNGSYGFEKAIIMNRYTKEVSEKSFNDIFNDENEFKEWGNLFNFQIIINDDTEYFQKKDKSRYVLNEGLAFEVVGDNMLQLHFSHWRGYDFNTYDVTVFLNWQPLYG